MEVELEPVLKSHHGMSIEFATSINYKVNKMNIKLL
jgi:hypothetical protein